MTDASKANASTYCDYNEMFSTYDQLRQPNGLPELIRLFEAAGGRLERQILLEGGFGTGAYLDRIRQHVRAAFGVEGSAEGVHQASKKMAGAANVHLQIGNILHLAFPEGSFDGYMVNQVLHHLDEDPDFPSLNIFLKEALRVLKPGGLLTVNTCSQEQLDPYDGSFWHNRTIVRAAYAIRRRHVPVDELTTRMERFGFTKIQTTIPSGKLFTETYYHDPRIALTPAFKKGDSVYCFCSPAELEDADKRLRSGIADGSIKAEMARSASKAAEIGESVIVSARRPF